MLQRIIFIIVIFCTTGIVHASTPSGACPTSAPVSGNHCVFVAANGLDTYDGTTETISGSHGPFKNMPGMANCASNCAAITLTGGNGVILRGGDTYHFSNDVSNSTNTFLDGTIHTEHESGTSTNCQLSELVGAIVKTSCLYFGVDKTWYSGSSWTRPVISGDNSFSTSWVSSCSYNDDTNNVWFFGSYEIIDNFELSGFCFGTNTNGAYITQVGAMEEMSNLYYHGWTVFPEMGVPNGGINSGSFSMVGRSGGSVGFLLFDHNIVDGSDSSDGTYTSTVNGFATGYIGCGNGDVIEYNVWRHFENGCVESNYRSIHDNLIEYSFNTGSMSVPNDMGEGEHGNVFESEDSQPTYAPTIYFYNNTLRHIGQGLGVSIFVSIGGTGYIFNNIWYDFPHSCLWTVGTQSGASTNYFIYNNTFGDSTCAIGSNNNTSANVNYTSENNQWVGAATTWPPSNGIPSWAVTNGHEVFMSPTTATSQGYVIGNNFQPTLSSNSTVHSGANLTSNCATFSVDSALCSGSSAGETSTINSGILGGTLIPSPPPRGSTFDAGGYQFSAGALTCLAPTISPNSGTVPISGITITESTMGCNIFYSTSGTATCSSTAYTTSLSFSIATTLSAVSCQSMYTTGGPSTGSYTTSGGNSTIAPAGVMLNFLPILQGELRQ